MANIWKRSEEWVTALRSNLFTWARIKLTVTYVCIILLILGVYSTVLFVGLRRNIRSSTDLNAEQQHHYVEKTIDHIQELITAIDIVMFLFAAVGSYWLAGITLKPIRFFMEAQQAFSADASHELRTPLAVMKTGIEVALRGNEAVPHGIREVLNSNLEEIDFMSTMTDQLLELSRTQNESHPFEPLDISSFVKSMA
jgi:signal transduction histidine kinase